MHQFAAAFLALVLAGVRGDEAATPQTLTVSVVEGSFDRIREGRCDAVGPTATSGDWMIRSDLTNDGRLPCDNDTRFEVYQYARDSGDWEKVCADGVKPLPKLVAANSEIGGFALLFEDEDEEGSYELKLVDTACEDLRGGSRGPVPFAGTPFRMVLMDSWQVVVGMVEEDDPTLQLVVRDGEDSFDASEVLDLSDTMSKAEYLAYYEQTVFVGGNANDGTGRRAVSRVDVDDDDDRLTWRWTTPIDGATEGSPRVYLRVRSSGNVEVLLVSKHFYARVDADSGEFLSVADGDFEDADLVAYDVVGDSLYAYNEPYLTRHNIYDGRIVRRFDVEPELMWADPATNESLYLVQERDRDEFFSGTWYHKGESRDFDTLHVIHDKAHNVIHIHLVVVWIGTRGRDEQLGTYYSWGSLSLDKLLFDYGEVGLVVTIDENGWGGYFVMGAIGDEGLVVAALSSPSRWVYHYLVSYVAFADDDDFEEVTWEVDLDQRRPLLVAIDEVAIAMVDTEYNLTLWDLDGLELNSASLPIDGTAAHMLLLDGGMRLAISRDDAPGAQLFDLSATDFDRLDTLDLGAVMSETEFMAYDREARAIFVGGNANDGRRAVTRLDVLEDGLTRAWTTAIDPTEGSSPHIHLRYDDVAAGEATEVLLVSTTFYARVDAMSGAVRYVTTEVEFAVSGLVAYDRSADALYGSGEGIYESTQRRGGTVVTRFDVETGARQAAVDIGYQLEAADPDHSRELREPEPGAFDTWSEFHNWFRIGLDQTINDVYVRVGDDGCASHVYLLGHYYGNVEDEDNWSSWFLMRLDNWCDDDALGDASCEDDDGWHKRNQPEKDCAWVAEYAVERCDDDLVGEDGVTSATAACRFTCGACTIRGCDDDTAWTVEGQPDKDCTWISESAKYRCPSSGAWQACRAACQTCTPLVQCDGDSGFHKKDEPEKDCAWVGEKPDTRCLTKGQNNGERGFQGCPAECGLCS